MGGKRLSGFFERFLSKDSLFTNKKTLQANYTPEHIHHRDQQIDHIANILAPSLKNEKPSNLFVYGKTGTGKTLTIKYTTQHIQEVAKEKNIPLRVIYINCKLRKVADTEYRLIAQLAREFGKEIPPTGLPTDEVYNIFFSALDKEKGVVLIILDEIDQLVGKVGDEILYNLTRINSELKHSQVAIIGISNDIVFTDNLDPRVKSSLSEEEIVFPPYNALQIQKILRQRADQAFKKGVLTQGLIEKCAAYAAREHGDARRALELLRVAGELAEREGKDKVGIEHLDHAEEKIEHDRMIDIVRTQPKQYQATLYSIIKTFQKRKEAIFTGEIYDHYQKICLETHLRPLTQRRISSIIAEFDMLGIINARVISKGRYGRTREISLSIARQTLPKVTELLEEGLTLS